MTLSYHSNSPLKFVHLDTAASRTIWISKELLSIDQNDPAGLECTLYGTSILFSLNREIEMIKEPFFHIFHFQKKKLLETPLFGAIRPWLELTLSKEIHNSFSVMKKITLISEYQIATRLEVWEWGKK